MANTLTSHETLTAAIRDPLLDVLGKYYEVDGHSFADTDPIAAAKHQSLHLLKLVKKLVVCQTDPSPGNKRIVSSEVAPDLVIYAQELMIKFDVAYPNNTSPDANQHFPLKSLLTSHQQPNYKLADVVLETSIAAGALADICDQWDHRQKSIFAIDRDVAMPFIRAAATLTTIFDINIDEMYAQRLRQMVEKYESWDK